MHIALWCTLLTNFENSQNKDLKLCTGSEYCVKILVMESTLTFSTSSICIFKV